MGPRALEQVLSPLTSPAARARYDHPDLIVGLRVSDDAAVYRINSGQAIVQTLDFFPPVVDDAYYYGAIAAANAMSDVYAMGGEVVVGLSIAAWPEDLPHDLFSQILLGAADTLAEVGAVLSGGHTVTDKEPKFGLSVTGLVDPQRALTKAAARPGDVVYLTKPLGVGVITTAHKRGIVQDDHLATAIATMRKLNRTAAQIIQSFNTPYDVVAVADGALRPSPVGAVTDVTGFGILGHTSEIADHSHVTLHLDSAAMPFLPGAQAYAEAGAIPGGKDRNQSWLMGWEEADAGARVAFRPDPQRADSIVDLLFDPETSGGLVFSVSPTIAADVERAFADAGHDLWRVGTTTAPEASGLLVIVT